MPLGLVSMMVGKAKYEERCAYLHLLGGVVAGVDGVAVLAGLGEQLAAVDGDGCHGKGTVAADHVATVLPLHNGAGT